MDLPEGEEKRGKDRIESAAYIGGQTEGTMWLIGSSRALTWPDDRLECLLCADVDTSPRFLSRPCCGATQMSEER